MRTNKYKYEAIIREDLGKEYMQQSEYIKEKQCVYCLKACTKQCRLNVRESKCINYKEK